MSIELKKDTYLTYITIGFSIKSLAELHTALNKKVGYNVPLGDIVSIDIKDNLRESRVLITLWGNDKINQESI